MERKHLHPAKKSLKNKSFCSVYGCSANPKKDPYVAFHLFPKKGVRKVEILNINGQTELVDLRKAWEINLKMAKPVTSFMKVCSLHFSEDAYNIRGFKNVLFKNAVPTQNLPSIVAVKSRSRSYCYGNTPVLNVTGDPLELHLSTRGVAERNIRKNLQLETTEASSQRIAQEWVVSCRREDLLNKNSAYLYNNCCICSAHFEENMFLNFLKNRLKPDAVPVLFTIPNTPPQKTIKRKVPANRTTPPVKSKTIKKQPMTVYKSCKHPPEWNQSIKSTPLNAPSTVLITYGARKADNLQGDATTQLKQEDDAVNQQPNEKSVKEEELDDSYENYASASGSQYTLPSSLPIKKEEDVDIEIQEHNIEIEEPNIDYQQDDQNINEIVFSKFENNALDVDTSNQAFQMDILSTDSIRLSSNIVNTLPSTSATGNNRTSTVNIPGINTKQRVRNIRKNIVKKASTVVTPQLVHNSPDLTKEENNINSFELCVLCAKDISKLRTKKSLSKFLEMIFTVTGVDIKEYKMLPYACEACYKSVLAIQRFQKQVTQAKTLISEKLSHVVSNEKPCEFEFVSVDINEKLPTLDDVNDRGDVEMELDDAKELHVTEIRDCNETRTKFNQGSSKMADFDVIQSTFNKTGSKNAITFPITEVNVEEGNSSSNNKKNNKSNKNKSDFNIKKIREVHKGPPHIVCKICKKQLKRGSLESHMRSHKSVSQNPRNKYSSSQCGPSYSQISSSKQHQLIHEEKKSFCHICK